MATGLRIRVYCGGIDWVTEAGLLEPPFNYKLKGVPYDIMGGIVKCLKEEC